jgi:iron complex transport system substrate-binding protein
MVSRSVLSRRALLGAGAALLATGGAAAGVPLPRLAVTELDLAEAMLALGVAPVAMTEAARYRALFADPPLPDACIELGAAWEPNLEQLAQVAPDATLVSSAHGLLVPQIAKVSPVAVLAPPEDGGRAVRAFALLAMVGRHLGRTEAAGAAAARARARIVGARARIADAQRPVFLVALADGGPHVEMYGPGTILDDALRALGVPNAARGAMPDYGWVVTTVAALAAEPDAAVLVLDFGAATARALHRLSASAFWRSLPPVAAGRVRRVPAVSVWGGAPTLALFAERVADALAEADPRRSAGGRPPGVRHGA